MKTATMDVFSEGGVKSSFTASKEELDKLSENLAHAIAVRQTSVYCVNATMTNPPTQIYLVIDKICSWEIK